MKNILCYGDSNTYGMRPIGFDIFETPLIMAELRYLKEERWPGVLQKELGDGFSIIEEGLCARTTGIDDPIEGVHKNGKSYLLPCLESHSPIDLAVIMLGTNDLKIRFSVPAFDIALSIGNLIDITKNSATGPGGKSPEILIICPPPIGKLTLFSEMLEDSIEKSKKLPLYYEKIARLSDCKFLDAGEIIISSDIDGIHLDKEQHKKLGLAVYGIVKKIFK